MKLGLSTLSKIVLSFLKMYWSCFGKGTVDQTIWLVPLLNLQCLFQESTLDHINNLKLVILVIKWLLKVQKYKNSNVESSWTSIFTIQINVNRIERWLDNKVINMSKSTMYQLIREGKKRNKQKQVSLKLKTRVLSKMWKLKHNNLENVTIT